MKVSQAEVYEKVSVKSKQESIYLIYNHDFVIKIRYSFLIKTQILI